MATPELQGKIALVTGSSRGIGRAVAERLAAAGAGVVVNYSGSADAAKEAVDGIVARGGKAVAIKADMGKVGDIKRLFDEAIAHFGKIDILVNNAGILFNQTVAETSEADFDRIMAINVKGVFFACQQAATRLADGGRIINFSSSTTARLMPLYGAYVATKGAVEQLTRTLAKELGARGITVNAISPGPTETELFLNGKSQEQLDFFGKQSAFGRIGKPDEIADAVLFLASEASRWVSGQNLRVNGALA